MLTSCLADCIKCADQVHSHQACSNAALHSASVPPTWPMVMCSPGWSGGTSPVQTAVFQSSRFGCWGPCMADSWVAVYTPRRTCTARVGWDRDHNHPASVRTPDLR